MDSRVVAIDFGDLIPLAACAEVVNEPVQDRPCRGSLAPLGLGGSNLLSSLSMRCQRSSGKAQSVKIVALSAIGHFVLRLINQENIERFSR